MNISHNIVNVSGENIIYVYVTVEDIYEFGKENFGNGKDTNFLKTIRQYVKNNLKEFRKAGIILVINGVVIGTLTLSAIMPKYNGSKDLNKNNNQIEIYDETTNVNIYTENKVEEIKVKENLKEEVKEENKIEQKEENAETKQETNKQVTTSNTNKVISQKKPSTSATNKTNTTTTKKPTTNVSTTNATKPTTSNTTTTTNKSEASATPNETTSKPTTNTTSTTTTKPTTTPTTSPSTSTTTSQNTATTVTSGKTIKFNNGGVITNIDLEEYVIGVVAAEMPASFHSEALKAQAVVARTYAMKKASQGITLVNSTSHQVYNSVEQMKSKWGSSFNTYYNKIKNAVQATKGKVLKYNGQYIEALYFSMSNGKTELPKYVWSTNYPYLQVVSSLWDENISAAKHTITMTYSKLSSKLGVDVNEDSEIKVLSKTAGDRVNEISIAGKTFTGVKVRSLLGLRSADFTINKTNTGVSITTIGFGHGVGMSQYGANGAAKAGYTYKQILTHYYSGASLISL